MKSAGQQPRRMTIPHAPVVLGAVLVVAGFVALAVGWHGASANLFEAEQWPYLVSGGLGGLALIDLGVTVLRTHHGRLIAAQQLHHLMLTRAALTEPDAR